MKKALRATVCLVLSMALAALAPGASAWAAAGEVVSGEVRGGGTPTIAPRGSGELKVLPTLEVQDLSRLATVPVLSEGSGVELAPIPAGTGMIQTGVTAGVNGQPGVPEAGLNIPETGLVPLASVEKAVAPGLRLIAQPNASGESSTRAGDEVTTILQGGRADDLGAAAALAPGVPAERGSLLTPFRRGARRIGAGAFFGAGVMSLGAAATGGVAAGLILLPLMIASFVLHEVAHARVAYWLGDPGPILENRGSLKPRDWVTHFDWLWSLAVPVATFIATHTIIGGAKPVEFDSSRFKKTVGPVVGAAIAGAAGPAMNLVLAGLGALAFAGLGAVAAAGAWIPVVAALSYATGMFAVMNAAIAVFNLMPFYPLDGHFVAKALIPSWAPAGVKEFLGFFLGVEPGVAAWIPFAVFMGVIMKAGLVVTTVSWLATLILGGPGAAVLHLAAAALPAAAGLLIGRMRDTGVPALKAQPQVAEHRFMKERFADVRGRLASMGEESDQEWRETLERQADGYRSRMTELEDRYPELRGR
ncbi:MAG: site-2 protease family protein [Elusimicrobia bacterium]|nr:site-2 protease family protein [Elusimicrobiota bacterium]